MVRSVLLVTLLVAIPLLTLATPAAGVGAGACHGPGFTLPIQSGAYYVNVRTASAALMGGADLLTLRDTAADGVWIYQETNRIDWLQAGSAVGPDVDPCSVPTTIPRDTLVL